MSRENVYPYFERIFAQNIDAKSDTEHMVRKPLHIREL